jgi:hypothetical protein
MMGFVLSVMSTSDSAVSMGLIPMSSTPGVFVSPDVDSVPNVVRRKKTSGQHIFPICCFYVAGTNVIGVVVQLVAVLIFVIAYCHWVRALSTPCMKVRITNSHFVFILIS